MGFRFVLRYAKKRRKSKWKYTPRAGGENNVLAKMIYLGGVHKECLPGRPKLDWVRGGEGGKLRSLRILLASCGSSVSY